MLIPFHILVFTHVAIILELIRKINTQLNFSRFILQVILSEQKERILLMSSVRRR